MTDAVLRFLVQLDDKGLGKLKAGLKDVAKTGGTTATATSKAGAQTTRALQRIAAAETDAARKSVDAAVRRQAALRKQVDQYQAVARAAKKGSHEHVTASVLAEKASRRLARETNLAAGQVSRGWLQMGRSARRADGDMERASRGALAASGILGRALAFGSTAFLGGAGSVVLARKVYDEATEAERVEKQLQTQLNASGLSYLKYRDRIDQVADAQSELAAIDDELVKKSLTGLIRTTGDVNSAVELNAIALDVSAGKHIALETAAGVVGKVFAGNLGILKRYGIELGDVKTPLEALTLLQQRFAGQAAAAGSDTAGAFAKAKISIDNFLEGVGTGALPEITRRLHELSGAVDDPDLNRAGERLGKSLASNVGGAIEKIVRETKQNWPEIKDSLEDGKTLLEGGAAAAQALVTALREISNIVPGRDSILRHLVELLVLRRLLVGKGGGGGSAGLLGGAAAGAAAGGLAGGRGGRAGLRGAAGRAWLPLAIGMTGREVLERGGNNPPPWVFNFKKPIGGKGPLLNWMLGNGFQSDNDRRAEEQAREAARRQAAAGAELAREKDKVESILLASNSAIAAALNDTGTQLKQGAEKLKERATEAGEKVADAFEPLADKWLQAFDAASDRLEDNLTVKVRAAGREFTFREGGQTPAERELAALDARERSRQRARNTADARRELQEALAARRLLKTQTRDFQVGDKIYTLSAESDPQARQEADRRVTAARERIRELQQQRVREQLEARAAVEQKAAATKLAAALKELNAQRALIREHLVGELDAVAKKLAEGKISAAQARREVLAILARYKLDLRQAGLDLGKAFTTSLNESMRGVEKTTQIVRDLRLELETTLKRLAEVEAARARRAKAEAAEAKKEQEKNRVPPVPTFGGSFPQKEPTAKPSSGTRRMQSTAAAPTVHIQHADFRDEQQAEVFARRVARAITMR